MAVCFFGPIPPPPCGGGGGGGGGLFVESNKPSQSSQRTNQSSAPAVHAFVTLVALSVGQKSNKYTVGTRENILSSSRE